MRILDTIKIDVTPAYEIIVGEDLLQSAAVFCADELKSGSIFVITDENSHRLFYRQLNNAFNTIGHNITPIIIAPGERSKNFTSFEGVIEEILSHPLSRKSTIIALGGGVVGDMAGFAASVLMRGINLVQIPTTLLAQVDSSVGGKNGINSRFGKNLIGTFYQPRRVFIDINMLKTLPEREMLAGFAEVIKYGLINDAAFFVWLKENAASVLNRNPDSLAYITATSCRAKADIVGKDEKEAGQRMLLNLGHTFGHALEAFYEYNGLLLHGEAVAIGMCMAFDYSAKLGLCPESEAEEVRDFIKSCGLPVDCTHLPPPDPARLLEFMMQDKKAGTDSINLILAHAIAKSFIHKEQDMDRLGVFLRGCCRFLL